MATSKTKGTNAKIKELKGIKAEKVTEEQLTKIQNVVDRINQTQMNIGALEARKHQALHFIASYNDDLKAVQDELEKEYGTYDINIQAGIFKNSIRITYFKFFL